MTYHYHQHHRVLEEGDDASESWVLHLAQGFLSSNSSLLSSSTDEASDGVNSTNVTYYGHEDDNYQEEEEEVDDYYNNKFLLILPRIAGLFSLMGVICVAMEAFLDLRKQKERETRAVTRTTTAKNVSTAVYIQFFYQIPLFCHGLAFALGTMTAPVGEAWGAVGNNASCSFQGILMQFGTYGAVGWDCALSTAYILMVRYKVAEVQLQRYKIYYHAIIWPIALAVSIYPLTQQMYNLNGTLCWIESYPNNCEGTLDDPCLRGEGAPLWQNIASLMVILHLLYSVGVMIVLYCAIRNMETTTDSELRASAGSSAWSNSASRSNGDPNNRRSSDGSVTTYSSTTTARSRRRRYRSRAVGIQGMLYASAYLVTVLPTPVYIVLWNTAGLWNDAYAIFATSILGALGYVNMILFLRQRSIKRCHTRYAKALRRGHDWLYNYRYYTAKIWKRFQEHCPSWLLSILCCCCFLCRKKKEDNNSDINELLEVIAASEANQRNNNSHGSRGGGSGGKGGGKGKRRGGGQSVSPNNSVKRGKQAPLASIQEDESFNNDDDDGAAADPTLAAAAKAPTTTTTSKGKKGKFTGVLIKVKDQNQKVSQWISELGASSYDSDSDDSYSNDDEDDDDELVEDDDEENDDNVSRDNAPSVPRRVQSTCVLELDEDTEEQEEDDEMSQTHRTVVSVSSDMLAPPCKPIRCISEVEPNDDFDDSDQEFEVMKKRRSSVGGGDTESITSHCTNKTNKSNKSNATPPVRPVRCVSEVEIINNNDYDASDTTGSDDPTAAALLLAAKKRLEKRPPQVPTRYTSEVEQPNNYYDDSSTAYDDDDDNNIIPIPRQQHRRSSAPQMPLRCASEMEEISNHKPVFLESNKQQPPQVPQRYTSSEVEQPNNNYYDESTSYADDDDNIIPIPQPQPQPQHRRSSAPQMPLRCASEMEEISNHKPFVDIVEKQQPPQMPQRQDSEAQVKKERPTDGGVIQSPPQIPQRYTSEIEEVSNHQPFVADIEKQPPQMPQRQDSEARVKERPTDGKPIRIISEVEPLSESESSSYYNDSTTTISSIRPQARQRYHHQPSAAVSFFDYQGPPCQPLRLESEVEAIMPDSSGSSHSMGSYSGHNNNSTLNRRSLLIGGGNPYSNDMDASDGSSSLDGSFQHYRHQQQHQQPQQKSQQQQPPTRPLRFPSEMEDSCTTSGNGSSALLDLLTLDAITEHSSTGDDIANLDNNNDDDNGKKGLEEPQQQVNIPGEMSMEESITIRV